MAVSFRGVPRFQVGKLDSRELTGGNRRLKFQLRAGHRLYPVTNTHHHCITTELPAGYHLATGRLPLRRVGAGELKIIAAILEAPVIEKTFTHLGLQARAPPPAPARGSQLPAA
jgi:hypothetical protein